MLHRNEQKIEKVFVTHLAQAHKPNNLNLEDITDSMAKGIVQSQFEIAKFLLAHPNDIIVLEGLTIDKYNKYEFRIDNEICRIFQNGFPEHFDELNEEQKRCLFSYGGANILFHLKLLKTLYKYCDDIKEMLILKTIEKKRAQEPSDYYIPELFEPRERQAICWGRKRAFEKNNPNIIIVFGAAHDFKKRIELIGDHSIVFKELIDTVPETLKKELDLLRPGKEFIEKLHYNKPNVSVDAGFDKYYQGAEQAETIEQLLEAGKKGKFHDFTELFEYAVINHMDLSNIKIKDNEYINILQWCIRYGDGVCFNKCLELTGNLFLNARSSTGETSLHYAVKANHERYVSDLILLGADKNIRDNQGMTPLDIAKQNDNFADLIELLRDGASVKLLLSQSMFSASAPYGEPKNVVTSTSAKFLPRIHAKP